MYLQFYLLCLCSVVCICGLLLDMLYVVKTMHSVPTGIARVWCSTSTQSVDKNGAYHQKFNITQI